MATYPTGPRLGSTPPQIVGVLNLRGSEKLTQSVYPAGAGFVQAKALGEDTVLQLFARARERDGVPVYDRGDECKVLGAGHGSQVAWWDGGVVLPYGNDPVWIPFKAGRFGKSATTMLHVGTEDYTVVSIDTDNDLAVLRSTQDKGKRERFDVTRWSLIKPGSGPLPKGWRLGGVPAQALRGTFQGCTISGATIYAVYGETTGKGDYAAPTADDQVYAYAWDWASGDQLARENYTTVSRLPGDVARSSEPEAIFILELAGELCVVIAVKSGSGGDGAPDEREVRLMMVGRGPKGSTDDNGGSDMATTAYGWTFSSDPAKFGGLTTIDCYGTKFRVRSDAHIGSGDKIIADLFRYLIFAFNRRVERIAEYKAGDDWSYLAKKNANDSRKNSEHGGGVAVDINATQHPNGASSKYVGFTKAQVATIDDILDEMEDVMEWGGNWHSTIDPMHFNLSPGMATDKGKAKMLRVVTKLRAIMAADPTNYGLAADPVVVPPKPAGPYKPDPANMGTVYASKLNPGVKDSDSVYQLQQGLAKLGFYLQTPTGEYGSKTVAAVKLWQEGDQVVDGDIGKLGATNLFKRVGMPVKVLD